MALDGVFLRHVKKEIEERLIGSRVDKIYQPSKEELVIAFRSREGAEKLLFSVRANSSRVAFISETLENPKQPPMLCMLLRKKLLGAKLTEVVQPQLERLLHFNFDALNELGDHIVLTLTIEIMGRYSNVILVDENGKIVDALKRVDAEMSSQRLVLPGIAYQLPPPQDKLDILTCDAGDIEKAVKAIPGDCELSKALLSVLQGVSPIVCREIQYQVGRGKDIYIHQMDEEQYFRMRFFCQKLITAAQECSGVPQMVVSKQNKPMDFSFMNILQYGTSAVTKEKDSFSQLLESFYSERDRIERMRAREQDLLRLLSAASERLSRKINAQKAELEQCAQRDFLKIMGDLISANMYSMEKGAESIELCNFYDEKQPMITIKLDPMLTPSQNAQKYYKEYRKAKTAEEKLTEQIELAYDELAYLDSVFDSLSRAENAQDLAEIRAELGEQGYVRVLRSKKEKAPPVSKPMEFQVSDGFTVLVGRNNKQNDRLTMKLANNNDIWFHTKNIPGSHTILVTEGRAPTEKAMEDAAVLAARYSKAKDSAQVPVDYTQVRNVNKPQGAKPGMVIYVNYKTMFVDPADENGTDAV